MPEGRIKCKIISFRLSDQEFGTVQETSRALGFKSVPHFARAATLTCNSSDPVHSPIEMEIDRLCQRIAVLTAALERIIVRLGVAMDPFNTV